MTSGRYPTNDEAKATFTAEEFQKAVEERMSERHYTSLISIGDEIELTARVLNRIADLIDDLPSGTILMGREISRRENDLEAGEHILSKRRSDMHYSENSPYYAAHMVKTDE